MTMPQQETRRPKVGLFVTCLVDLFRPTIGFAAIKLIEEAGCDVDVPRSQTCCGQPAYNSGDRRDAIAIAKQVITAWRQIAVGDSCAVRIDFEDVFYHRRADQTGNRQYAYHPKRQQGQFIVEQPHSNAAPKPIGLWRIEIGNG